MAQPSYIEEVQTENFLQIGQPEGGYLLYSRTVGLRIFFAESNTCINMVFDITA